MANMVNVYLYGKKYEVPDDLTIMEAFEYAGYDFEQAIRIARAHAVTGGNVLLSPACASFDMFTDYENRGQIFKEKVMAMQ